MYGKTIKVEETRKVEKHECHSPSIKTMEIIDMSFSSNLEETSDNPKL